jgi:IS4 transposase
VTLSAPSTPHRRDRPPLRLWAVHVVEKNPPPDATAIQRLLYTTVQVASAQQVLKCVRWSVRRWRIEEWQRVMKSGRKILEHQNRDATVLQRAIALATVIAWRIMLLVLLGRTAPGLPADLVFDAGEGEVRQLLT